MSSPEQEKEVKVEKTESKKDDSSSVSTSSDIKINERILGVLEGINKRLISLEEQQKILDDAERSSQVQQELMTKQIEEHKLTKEQEKMVEERQQAAFEEFVHKLENNQYSKAEIDQLVMNDDPYFLNIFYKAVWMKSVQQMEAEMGDKSQDRTKDFNLEEFKMKYARKNKEVYVNDRNSSYLTINAEVGNQY